MRRVEVVEDGVDRGIGIGVSRPRRYREVALADTHGRPAPDPGRRSERAADAGARRAGREGTPLAPADHEVAGGGDDQQRRRGGDVEVPRDHVETAAVDLGVDGGVGDDE